MKDLPPEDLPDEITIGPVGPIPIIDDDDPRFEAERSAWSSARARAQAFHSVEELLDGVDDDDWRVRFESIDRLIARWRDDPRTPLAVRRIAEHDPVWQVRSNAMMRLHEFDADLVREVLLRGLSDSNEEVRSSARYALDQLPDA
jgi:HEAT repeat protein